MATGCGTCEVAAVPGPSNPHLCSQELHSPDPTLPGCAERLSCWWVGLLAPSLLPLSFLSEAPRLGLADKTKWGVSLASGKFG